eukprot:278289-Chlamydomonas_euryale.AAC.1
MERPDQVVLPSEFLNTIYSSELPPHELKLEEGCPLMCFRNINPKLGLMNGTRLILRGAGTKVLWSEMHQAAMPG